MPPRVKLAEALTRAASATTANEPLVAMVKLAVVVKAFTPVLALPADPVIGLMFVFTPEIVNAPKLAPALLPVSTRLNVPGVGLKRYQTEENV